MKTKERLICSGGVAAAALGGLALAPPFIKSSLKGATYGMGLRNGELDGFARTVATFVTHADHPPCFAQMMEHVQYLTKIPINEFYRTNAMRLAEAHKQVADWYGIDIPLPVGDAYNYEAEALGAKMIYSDVDMPTIDRSQMLINEKEDIYKVSTDFQPDWGRLRYVADNAKAMKICGLPKFFVGCAPFSLACQLRSYPQVVRDMRKDPKFAHEFFTWITDEVALKYYETVHRMSGARILLAADAWAAFPNLTTEMIEDWVVPYNIRYLKNLLRKGAVALPLGSGLYDEREERFDRDTLEKCMALMSKATLGKLAKKGLMLVESWDFPEFPLEWLQDYSLRNKFKLYGKRPIIIGLTHHFLQDGPAETIVDFIKKCIDVMGREGRLAFFFEQIPAFTPPEHIHAAVAAIRTYGRYPIAENLDDVKFEMPEFEPFGTWLSKQ